MKILSKIFLFLMLAFITTSLCACGKSSLPEPFSGSGYPHSYPRK